MTKKNSKIDRKHLNVRENKENRRRFWNNRDGASVEADVCSSAPDVYRHFITSCKFTHLTNTHTHTEAATVTHTHRCLSVTDLRLWSTWGSADHRFIYRDPTKENTLIVVDHGRFWELVSEINLLSFFCLFCSSNQEPELQKEAGPAAPEAFN